MSNNELCSQEAEPSRPAASQVGWNPPPIPPPSAQRILRALRRLALVILLGAGPGTSLGLTGCGPTVDTPVPEGGWVQISAGERHSCAVHEDGGLWCWGANRYGQVGDGSLLDQRRPVEVPFARPVLQVTCGRHHTCALLEGGAIHCWGRNAYGQLGDGTQTDRPTPVGVTRVSGMIQVDAGDRHTCAVEGGGQVWCWGANSTGQLGIGDAAGPERCEGEPPLACATQPEMLAELGDVAQVAVGGWDEVGFGCAVTQLHHAFCWGANDEQQLGDGTLISRNRPVEVTGLVGVQQLSAGAAHACAVLSDGTSHCWGRDFGAPFYISLLSDVASIRAGLDYTCARLEDQTLHCWGENGAGQLGDGSQNDQGVPTPVRDLGGVLQASAGGTHTCAVDGQGVAWCWGRNQEGQLGATFLLTSWTPVSVGSP